MVAYKKAKSGDREAQYYKMGKCMEETEYKKTHEEFRDKMITLHGKVFHYWWNVDFISKRFRYHISKCMRFLDGNIIEDNKIDAVRRQRWIRRQRRGGVIQQSEEETEVETEEETEEEEEENV